MALGVDSAAHVGRARRRRGAAVAVLAGGADVAVPGARARGCTPQVRERGCVVSELPPGFTAFRWCFPARNRLIAALAALTVVVEAAERSGSLITADFAAELGRAVGAVPGPVTSRFSAGTNALLAAGAGWCATPATCSTCCSDRRAEPPARARRRRRRLEPRLRALLDAIEAGSGSLAELAADARRGGAGSSQALDRARAPRPRPARVRRPLRPRAGGRP